jgi:hypothetical protein
MAHVVNIIKYIFLNYQNSLQAMAPRLLGGTDY